MSDNDDNDFLKWKEENKKEKSNKKGLSKRAKGRIKTIKQPARKKRTLTRRTEKRKKKLYITTKQRELDFLKYSLIVEHWAMIQFGLSRDELGLLYYFYSEDYFTKLEFLEMSKMLIGRTNYSFNKFVRDGVISEIPRKDIDSGDSIKIPHIYRLSFKYKNRVKAIYNRLSLHTQISESNKKSLVFRTQKASNKDKRIARAIVEMNKDIEEIKNGGKGYIDEDFFELV